MPKGPSPHALTLISLIANAAELTIRHHDYDLARDVITATRKIAIEFGFEIDDEIFGYIIESIDRKPPLTMSQEFERLVMAIQSIDRKMDKEQLLNDRKTR